MPGTKNRFLLFILCVAFLVIAGGITAWLLWRQPVTTAELRGEATARKLGCFACHGAEGVGGIADPTSPSGNVPGWESGVLKLYVKNEQELREWILYGAPKGDSLSGEKQGSDFLVPMPAYEDHLTKKEVDDLVSYILAVSGQTQDMPDNVYEGWKITSRIGCFGCHGHSGLGGMPNPGSFKGYIPPWNGDEFTELVHNDTELREWILDGKPTRLWENPAARYFLERQKIPMPAYRSHLSEEELTKIVAYIKWLRKEETGSEVEISPIG